MLIDRVQATKQLLEQNSVTEIELGYQPPVDESAVARLEEAVDTQLPEAVRFILRQEVGAVNFRWRDDRFGLDCRRGHLQLLSPREIVRTYEMQLDTVHEAERHGWDADDDGISALVEDWPSWIPVFRFPSGDCFCLERRSGEGKSGSVVFLEHDVMDQGPTVHGLKLASTFVELLETWSEILFVDVYDWTKAIVDGHISNDAPVFQPMLEVLGRRL